MTGPQIVKLTTALRAAFTASELGAMLQKLGHEFTDYAVAATVYPDQVAQVVAAANSAGWIGQLVYEAVASRPDNLQLREFLTLNPDWDPARHPPASHPCDTLRVFGGKCFIGRQKLRSHLKDIERPTTRKVLLVTSEQRKVGKTYSTELVNYLSQSGPHSQAIPIDLDQDDYDQAKLARTLARHLGLPPDDVPKQDEQQAPRWNQDLVQWLVPLTPPEPGYKVYWIVLDGFRLRIPSEGLQDFIAQLAQRINSTVRFRLVLLNYTCRLPLGVDAFCFKDRVTPIERQEVSTFLAKIHERRHGSPPTPEELADYLAAVYDLHARNQHDYPESADDQLLMNMAVSDAADLIER